MAKLKDKLYNRIIEGNLTLDENDSALKLIKSLIGTKLKNGYYLLNEDGTEFNFFEEVPDNYTGLVFRFADDGLYIMSYENGSEIAESFIAPSQITFYDYVTGKESNYSTNGASDLNFVTLTHSFNELDATLKQIVLDAIADGGVNGVACTQAQWNEIKALLDKSLYINYNDYSMIKSVADGISIYVFGSYNTDSIAGAQLSLNYSVDVLNAKMIEV